MQSDNWNDLKFFLALYRTGKLKDAGRGLGVSETTVARRIDALEQHLGAAMFVRSATGRYEPTDAALQILPQAEAIETAHRHIDEASRRAGNDVSGTVRISSVPMIVNRWLVPNTAALMARHPRLTIELVPSSDNLDLSRREADLALRFARPASGGLRIRAQKLGTLAFAAYSASERTSRQDAGGWITYDDAHGDLPQARWLEAFARRSSEQCAPLVVADAETALEAVANGLGKSLLPRVIADADPRLQRLPDPPEVAMPIREIWLLAHVDQASRSSIMVTKDWLATLGWA